MTAEQLEDVIADAVTFAVKAAAEPLRARIAELERTAAIAPRDGRDGIAGVQGLQGERGADGIGIVGPPGLAGRDGINGKDADAQAIRNEVLAVLQMQMADLVKAQVAVAVAQIPMPRDGTNGTNGLNGIDGKHGVNGTDGKDGTNGRDGIDGKNGLDGKDGMAGRDGRDSDPVAIETVIAYQVKDAVNALPKAKDGLNGTSGKDGVNGLDGKDGAAGRDGRDGVQGINGQDGTPGRDGLNGKDGLGFDDVTVEHDGERRFTMTLANADRRKDLGTFIIPATIYRGTWQNGVKYERGDETTWNDSQWIAKADTTEKPGDGKTAWQLAVKRGERGAQGLEGKAGRDGRDLTQMDSTGRKW